MDSIFETADGRAAVRSALAARIKALRARMDDARRADLFLAAEYEEMVVEYEEMVVGLDQWF